LVQYSEEKQLSLRGAERRRDLDPDPRAIGEIASPRWQ
jgi:hypothetical protein